jgi:hypothetical protein
MQPNFISCWLGKTPICKEIIPFLQSDCYKTPIYKEIIPFLQNDCSGAGK